MAQRSSGAVITMGAHGREGHQTKNRSGRPGHPEFRGG